MMELPWKSRAKSPSKETSSSCISFSYISQLRSDNSDDLHTSQLHINEDLISFTWVSSSNVKVRVNDNKTDMQRSSCSSPSIMPKKSIHEEAHQNPLLQPLTSLASSLEAVFVMSKSVKTKQKVQNGRAFFCCLGLGGRQIDKLNLSQAESVYIPEGQSNEKTMLDAQFHHNEVESKTSIESEKQQVNKVAMHESAFVTVKHLSAGALSAIVSRSFVAPLERLKLEYMVRGARQNVIRIIELIILNEGIRGFWRGNVVNLLRTAPFKAVNFFCYDVYRKRLLEITGKEEASNFERLIAGAAAGISATLLCFPMDTIRTRMVAPGGEALGGVISCFQHMVHTEGFFSLYKGLWPAVISMAPSGAVFYGVYDILKTTYLHSPEGQEDLRKRIEMERRRRRIEENLPTDNLSEESLKTKTLIELKEDAGNLGQLELGPIRTLIYGAIAGICAETSTYPFEVIRRQMQMQTAATKMGAFATCRCVFQRGGIGALYSGLLPSALQVLPSAAISYFVYECMKIILKVPQ